MALDRDRMRNAIALSLVYDTYIDMESFDGEASICGDIVGGRLYRLAASIIDWYEADQETALAAVRARRAALGARHR